MSLKFQRNIENFSCKKCHAHVIGNGYTNHCPECLWSKHVDVFPGDRQSLCGGLMRPVRVELKRGDMGIIHVCEICSHEKRNRISLEDNQETVLQLCISEQKTE
jgi:RNase P subunit RPR2